MAMMEKSIFRMKIVLLLLSITYFSRTYSFTLSIGSENWFKSLKQPSLIATSTHIRRKGIEMGSNIEAVPASRRAFLGILGIGVSLINSPIKTLADETQEAKFLLPVTGLPAQVPTTWIW